MFDYVTYLRTLGRMSAGVTDRLQGIQEGSCRSRRSDGGSSYPICGEKGEPGCSTAGIASKWRPPGMWPGVRLQDRNTDSTASQELAVGTGR